MKMEHNTTQIFVLLLILATFLPLVLAEPSTSTYCCEKTITDGSCVNTIRAECNDSMQKSQASCGSTTYCQLGTCYDTDNGECSGNIAKARCLEKGGEFIPGDIREVGQCKLGCCILGDNAQLSTHTRCIATGTMLGINSDFNAGITIESECISSVQTQDRGACVTPTDIGRQCIVTTREDCGGSEGTITSGTYQSESAKTFYSGYLCSSGALLTNCGKQAETRCDDDDIYWYDTCGNRENVYSGVFTNKTDIISYNNGKLATPKEISPTRSLDGDCDYFFESICADWSKNTIGAPESVPERVASYCKSTTCIDKDKNPRKNLEAWCVTDDTNSNKILKFNDKNILQQQGEGLDLVGSEYFVKYCNNGIIYNESCQSNRREICIEGYKNVGSDTETSLTKQATARCVNNRNEECIIIDQKTDCENSDKRDCIWLGDSEISTLISTNSTLLSTEDGIKIRGNRRSNKKENGVCVSRYSQGLITNSSAGDTTCNLASVSCEVTYERDLMEKVFSSVELFFGGKVGGKNPRLRDYKFEILENNKCLGKDWVNEANKICVRQGDCGAYKNYENYKDFAYEYTGSIEGDLNGSSIQGELNKWIDGSII